MTIFTMLDGANHIITMPQCAIQYMLVQMLREADRRDVTFFLDVETIKLFKVCMKSRAMVVYDPKGEWVKGRCGARVISGFDLYRVASDESLNKGKEIAVFGGLDLMSFFIPNATSILVSQVSEVIEGAEDELPELSEEDWAHKTKEDLDNKTLLNHIYTRKNNEHFLPL